MPHKLYYVDNELCFHNTLWQWRYYCNVPSGQVKSRPSVSPEVIYLINIPNIESHLSSGNQVLHQYYGSGLCYF